jgi:Leucine-rich repeat (LRR) protein
LICNRTNLNASYEYPVSLLHDIRAARQMRHVQMDDCCLGCKGGLVLLNMLMQLPCVRTLSFQRNNIDDSAGSNSLFWLKPLSNALHLESLSLSQNLLHDEAVLFIIKVGDTFHHFK